MTLHYLPLHPHHHQLGLKMALCWNVSIVIPTHDHIMTAAFSVILAVGLSSSTTITCLERFDRSFCFTELLDHVDLAVSVPSGLLACLISKLVTGWYLYLKNATTISRASSRGGLLEGSNLEDMPALIVSGKGRHVWLTIGLARTVLRTACNVQNALSCLFTR